MRLAATSLVLLACACARSPRDEAAPLPVPADAGAILLLGVELPDAGSALGGHYVGSNFESRVASYQLTDAARVRWAQTARVRGEAVLLGSGYHVRRGGPASSDAQLLHGVQYGLVGRVQSMQVRTTGLAEPYRVEAQVVIGFETSSNLAAAASKVHAGLTGFGLAVSRGAPAGQAALGLGQG